MITALRRNMPALRIKPATELVYQPELNLEEIVGPIHLADRRMLYVITLSCSNCIIDTHLAAVGTVDSLVCNPREIFRYALHDSASFVCLVENSPRSLRRPTRQEKDRSAEIMEAGEIIDIPVIDHIIVSREGNFSFNEDEPYQDCNLEDNLPF